MKKCFRTLFLILAMTFMLSGCINFSESDKNTMVIKKLGNSSSGKYWKYTVDKKDIIEEVQHEVSYTLGPGYTDIWTFKAVGFGDVTINWTSYKMGGASLSDIGSYATTYTVDEKGIHEKSKTYKLYLGQKTKTSENKNWKYTVDNTDLLKQTDYSLKDENRDIRIEMWSFESVGEGGITFTWNEYKGDVLIKDSTYKVKYIVTKKGIEQVNWRS